uniref:Putative homing endonuclease n=1 Tax=viral metagenome TaxID=1070528 RepID=A0A6H1ZGI8_9ZZZZ
MPCRVCEQPNPDKHHVQPRSLAPDRVFDESNIVELCRPCHNRVHSHEWELCQEGEDLVLYEGEEEIKRMPPLLTEEEKNLLFEGLERGEEALEEVGHCLPRLTEEELVAVYEKSKSIGQRSWQTQMQAIVDEWRRLRPLKHKTDDKVAHISARFGIKRAQIYNYLLVFEKFNPDQLEWDLPMQMYLTAARTEKPDEWLEYAVSELADRPDYSASDLKADVRAAGGELEPLEFKIWAECPECGFEGKMTKRSRQ